MKTGKKRELPPIQTARFGSVAAIVGGCVYIIGGASVSGTTGTAEKYVKFIFS